MSNRVLTCRVSATAIAWGVIAWGGVVAAGGGWRLDTVGYLPESAKRASLPASAGSAGTPFRVVRLPGGETEFQGECGEDPNSEMLVADFSSVTTPGRYVLAIESLGQSPEFIVGDDVYGAPFRLALQAMTLWRCGAAVHATHNGVDYSHAACHLNDGYHLGDEEAGPSDGTGGWHDAGDYNKYVVNAGVSVGCLLRAWDDFGPAIEAALPTPAGDEPPLLAELRWELDWLLKMQRSDGSVSHKLSTLDFGPFMPPEEEHERRYFSDWGTAATASFVAMTSSAARVFEPYDPPYAERLLEAARRGRRVLVDHPDDRRPDLGPFTTGGYQSSDRDDRLWAAAEFWRTTGDAGALEELEEAIARLAAEEPEREERPRRRRRPRGLIDVSFDWGNVKNLALLAYLDADRPGRQPELVEKVRASLLRAAGRIASAAERDPHGRPLGDRYYWGCNGGVARQTLLLEAAHRSEPRAQRPRESFAQAQRDALHYLFGRNPFGRSMVTGIGHEPPLHPHDRRNVVGRAPWPGYLVGGPERGPLDWRDEQDDYRTNEIAINWNTALVYALASQLPVEPHAVRP